MPKGYKDAAIHSQFGTVFNWVVDHELKGAAGAIQLQADAASQLALGNTSWMDFVNKHQCDLQDQISFIWSLKTAPERLERLCQPRTSTLLNVACKDECANRHKDCTKVYEHVCAVGRISAQVDRSFCKWACERECCDGG